MRLCDRAQRDGRRPGVVGSTSDPLVVTLAVDNDVQQRWDDERRRLFPAGRTQVGAHVTLFHAVPGELEPDVRRDLAGLATTSFRATVSAVVPLAPHRPGSSGVSFARTVQNKVTPDVARATLAELSRCFTPYEMTASGFELWRCVSGPWQAIASFVSRTTSASRPVAADRRRPSDSD